MEYQKNENSWRENVKKGDLDGALKNIQIQIATNLMNVHNRFCKSKLTNPVDVFAYESYGKDCGADIQDVMGKFVQINYRFIEASHGLDFDSTYENQEVLEDFQNIEKILEEEMSRI